MSKAHGGWDTAFKKTLIICVILLGMFGPTADAADNSNASSHLAKYDNDNQVEWTCCFPTWRCFEMAFYNGNIFKMFYRVEAYYEHDCIAYYSHPVDADPEASPALTLLEFCDPPILSGPDFRCDQQIAGLRLCVFNGRLFVFYLKADAGYTYGSNWSLCYKSWDDEFETWSAQTKLLTINGGQVPYSAEPPMGGLVVKVMDGLVHLLMQPGGHKLYALKFDGSKLVDYDASHPPTFALENANDLILNGEIFLKLTDNPDEHCECVAFVTKDDGGYKPTGACKLYVFDPAAGSFGAVAKVAEIPKGPNGKGWKDLALAHGNVDRCEPYSISAIQIWGLPWDDKQLHHTQFIFNEDGTGGTFNATGWVDVTKYWSDAENSTHYKNDMRGMLAACPVPSPGSESGGTATLQMHTWVWWFARSTASHCHGRSLKYLADYLRLENPVSTDTAVEKDPNGAWILLGLVTGLPPYYPNGAEPADLEGFLEVQYGLSATQEIASTVTTENSFSFGYSKGKILKSSGVDGEFGISYSHAVEHTQKQSSKVTTKTQQTFSPLYADWPTYPDGQEAWALFLAPNISNHPYQVYTPPEAYAAAHPNAANDLEFTVYYLFTNASSVRAYSFDITQPETAGNGFFAGLPPMPSAYDYDDEGWKNPVFHRQECTDYSVLATTGITAPGSMTIWSIDYEDSIENEKGIKNKITVSGGAFGFKADMEGAIKSSSSVATTIGTSFEVDYALYTLYDNDPDKYPDWNHFLVDIGFDAFLLNAKTSDAFFIPDSCRTQDNTQYPWCLTWHVNYADNKGGDGAYLVGPGNPYGSVGAALVQNPGQPYAAILLTGSVTEGAPIAIGDRSVKIKGDAGTLDAQGRPTAVLQSPGISVGPDGHLSLANLILEGGAPAVLLNEGRLSLENCTVRGGAGHGIHQPRGTLRMAQVYIKDNVQDGLRVEGGYANLLNCEIVRNGGCGLSVPAGEVVLTHCGLLDNRVCDVASFSGETLKADNCLFGSMAPYSLVSRLRNCLVEALPPDVTLERAEACLFNVNAWPVMADGEIIDLYETSPCIDAGLEAGVGTDILGHPRLDRPDIGPAECTRSPITQIPAFTTFGLVLLFGLMAAAGCMVVRRRRGRA